MTKIKRTVKPFYKSKEVWIGIIVALNFVLAQFALPSVEPTPGLLQAIIALLVAIRVLLTQTKLSLK